MLCILLLVFLLNIGWDLQSATRVRPVGTHWLCKWILPETSAEGGQVARFSGGKKSTRMWWNTRKRWKDTYSTPFQRDRYDIPSTWGKYLQREQWPLLQLPCHDKDNKVRRGKCDIVLSCLGSHAWKNINVHGFLQYLHLALVFFPLGMFTSTILNLCIGLAWPFHYHPPPKKTCSILGLGWTPMEAECNGKNQIDLNRFRSSPFLTATWLALHLTWWKMTLHLYE